MVALWTDSTASTSWPHLLMSTLLASSGKHTMGPRFQTCRQKQLCHFLPAEITAVGGTLSAVASQLANYHELSESLESLMSPADTYENEIPAEGFRICFWWPHTWYTKPMSCNDAAYRFQVLQGSWLTLVWQYFMMRKNVRTRLFCLFLRWPFWMLTIAISIL